MFSTTGEALAVGMTDLRVVGRLDVLVIVVESADRIKSLTKTLQVVTSMKLLVEIVVVRTLIIVIIFTEALVVVVLSLK